MGASVPLMSKTLAVSLVTILLTLLVPGTAAAVVEDAATAPSAPSTLSLSPVVLPRMAAAAKVSLSGTDNSEITSTNGVVMPAETSARGEARVDFSATTCSKTDTLSSLELLNKNATSCPNTMDRSAGACMEVGVGHSTEASVAVCAVVQSVVHDLIATLEADQVLMDDQTGLLGSKPGPVTTKRPAARLHPAAAKRVCRASESSGKRPILL